MLTILFVLVATFFLAYWNGANDNFKGVASLLGSRTVNYRRAIVIATISTLLGSLTSAFVGEKLIKIFSGNGLVPDSIASSPHFIISIMIGSAVTIMIATIIGLPVSTTHALTGSLVGCSLALTGSLNTGFLAQRFLMPLLLSPLIAIALTAIIYPIFRAMRLKLGVSRETCVCIGNGVAVVKAENNSQTITSSISPSSITVGAMSECVQIYRGNVIGINAQMLLDISHHISASAVCFARGLNDTPKIVALLLGAHALNVQNSIVLIAIAMTLGGIINARKVAYMMSYKITGMNHGQGFSANLVTSILVIFASRFGMPVSTTHVSCGSLLGIGIINGSAHWGNILSILYAWFFTLPLAGALSALCLILT